MYHEMVLYLVGLWSQLKVGDYGHGYMVLAISGYLILRNRRVLAALSPRPYHPGLLAVLAASLIWMLAALVDVQLLQVIGLFLLVLAVVWTVLGSQVTRELLLPILFIGFAIPIWFPLESFLQNLSADVVFRAIRVLGIPALRQDNEIVLPAGMLSITAACSGLRYLLPALVLGTLYGYLNYVSLRARLLVVLVAAGAAVLVNLVRVFIIVYLGYATDMQHPFVEDHLTLGWYLFGGMVVILLVVDARLHGHHQPAITACVGDNNKMLVTSCENARLQYIAIVVSGAVLVSVGPVVVYWVNHQPHLEKGRVALELPSGVGAWAGPIATDDDWMPEYHGAITRKQAYQRNGERVYLYIGYYLAEVQGEELINDLNRISNEDVWHPRNPEGRLRQVGDLPVLEQVLVKGRSAQRLVWYWYHVAGQYTTNKYQAKALKLLGLVTGKSQASVIAVAIDLGDDTGHARKVLGEFVSMMKAPLAKLADHSQPEWSPDHD